MVQVVKVAELTQKVVQTDSLVKQTKVEDQEQLEVLLHQVMVVKE
jgi:hypothetical protein